MKPINPIRIPSSRSITIESISTCRKNHCTGRERHVPAWKLLIPLKTQSAASRNPTTHPAARARQHCEHTEASEEKGGRSLSDEKGRQKETRRHTRHTFHSTGTERAKSEKGTREERIKGRAERRGWCRRRKKEEERWREQSSKQQCLFHPPFAGTSLTTGSTLSNLLAHFFP